MPLAYMHIFTHQDRMLIAVVEEKSLYTAGYGQTVVEAGYI